MEDIRDYPSVGPERTKQVGETLGRCLQAGDLIGLIGDLGAGKTLLVQGIAQGLAVPPRVRVTSPTFTLINEYHGGRMSLYHADLYRIERSEELDELGLDEICRRGDGVVCVEWCDRFPVLGPDYLEVNLRLGGDAEGQERRLDARGTGPRARALAAAWARALE